jgi:signal transduction histidine kinase
MASHEFRTPLSAMLSSLYLIEQYSKPEQENNRKKHIEKIRYSINSLNSMLGDFLSLDKLEQGKVEISAYDFDLKQLAKDIVTEVSGILKPKQQINYEFDGDVEVRLDRNILRHVLQNLLSNASKYSNEGDEVGLRISVQSERVKIEVKDKGIGIPTDQQESIFTKFFRAKNTQNIQGTGLGLNIVKNYVGLMRGNISFTSKLNEGTSFFVDLPKTYSVL